MVVQALVQFEGVTYVVIGSALEVDGVITGEKEDGTDDTSTDDTSTDDTSTDETDTDDAGTDEVAKLEVSAVGVVVLTDAG
jgi:hypothetical protein